MGDRAGDTLCRENPKANGLRGGASGLDRERVSKVIPGLQDTARVYN